MAHYRDTIHRAMRTKIFDNFIFGVALFLLSFKKIFYNKSFLVSSLKKAS